MLELSTDVEVKSGQSERTRRCIVNGDDLACTFGVRFVVGPSNQLVPDILTKLPGRGIWVGATRNLLDTAVENRLFEKVTRRKVVVGSDLSNRVEHLLSELCIELLALARRAGEAVAGFEKSRRWLANGTGGVIFQASDCGLNAKNKIKTISKGIPVVRTLRGNELGRVFGRERSINVVLANGALANRLSNEVHRLRGFRSDGGERGNQ